LVEARVAGNADSEATESLGPLLEAYGKASPVLLAGGSTSESERRAVDEEYADAEVAVVFGRHFISNPNLVFRLRK
jgi:NADPH2 dehydrogenase